MNEEKLTEEELDAFLERVNKDLVKWVIANSPDTETALRQLKERAARDLHRNR